jgi:choline/carnitine/betaine transport
MSHVRGSGDESNQQEEMGMEKQGGRIDTPVFAIAAGISVVFVLVGVLFKDDLATIVGDVLSWVLENLGWLFVLSTAGFLIFVLYLAVTPYGRLRLGKDDDRPEFRTASWIAMMFSAGMGIGLMFYGVAEPISHLAAPPLGLAKPNTEEAAARAMEWTYFHWALHAWALYAIVGLALGFFCFRKGLPNLISSAFYPVLGERVNGPIGKAIDILAIFATMFGSATSLGLGALQINSGLNFVWDVEQSTGLAVVIIAVLTLLFVLSAVSGVGKGVQFLSNFNMIVAVVLLLFILVVGPTVFILGTLVSATGDYFGGLVSRSFQTGVFGGSEWLGSWTIFYWVWWISWTPFVGTFLARISKGRTIREFVIGVLLIPSGVSFVWFAILGGSAINLQLGGDANLIDSVAKPEVALFTLLEQFPISTITSIVVIVLVAVFFVSGADAASIVMGMLTCRGILEPPRAIVAFWGTAMGGVAITLLVAGGLETLQQAAIVAGAPFVLVMIGLTVSFFKALRQEELPAPQPRATVTIPDRTAPQPGIAGGSQ